MPPTHSSIAPVERPRLIVVGGGARSGKSRYALELARQLGHKRAFIATAQAFDDEMRERIAAHQLERGSEFVTFEATTDLADKLAQTEDYDVVVIDCLTLFISHLLLEREHMPAKQLETEVEAVMAQVLSQATRHRGTLIMVTNEVGMGVVPISALGRLFRDVAGRANQQLAAAAQQLYLATMGVVVRLRPGPIEVCPAPTSATPPSARGSR